MWRIRREREILRVAAKVISDPGELRVVDNGGACHNGKVIPIGVMFVVVESLHVRPSLSAMSFMHFGYLPIAVDRSTWMTLWNVSLKSETLHRGELQPLCRREGTPFEGKLS